MGGGKSSGSQSTQVQLTPEQQKLLGAQTDFLTGTAFPTYQKTISQAGDVYGRVNPAVEQATNTAMGVTGRTGMAQEIGGMGGLATGMSGLASLFDPQYEQQQVDAALQAGRESARESQAGQNAMYGSSGGLGSSRMALADKNLSSLNAQRQATAAAGARAGVQANKAAAANQLATLGSSLLTGANTTAAGRTAIAQSPQDAFAKYAQVVFGTPQASTTPNFAGTQSGTQQSSGKGMGFKL
jgi:hypothetical protein